MNKLNGLAMLGVLSALTLTNIALSAAAQDREDPRQRDRDRQRDPVQDRDPKPRGDNQPDQPAQPSTTPSPRQPPTRDPSANAPKPDRTPSANDEPIGGRMSPIAAQKKILLEEAKYRNQKARIARLRELAKQQGNEERLAALDKLEAKMTELHDRKVAAARASLGDRDFEKLKKELEKGRGHAKGNDKSPGKGNDDHPGAGKGKNKDDEHGKPDSPGRPGGAGSSNPGRGNPDPAKGDQSGDDHKGGKPDNAGGKGKGKP